MRADLSKHLAMTMLAAAAAAWGEARAATITLSCGAVSSAAVCAQIAEQWARDKGHTVKFWSPPAGTKDRLTALRQLFAAASPEVDVVDVDAVWIGALKEHLVDLGGYSKGAEKAHFPAIVAANTLEGKLLAMPWFTDAGLLFYRKDLLDKYALKPPQTWDELTTAARTIMAGERAAGTRDFQGFVFQAKAYEGLTCDALEWVHSHGGGEVVDKSGKVTINNPKAAQALDRAAQWIGDIAPPGVLNFHEEDARAVWQGGKAAFMRNWPYAWALGQAANSPVKGKFGVMPLPKGPDGQSAATLGGWHLALSKYSRNADAAAELLIHMTSPEVQKKRAVAAALNPTIPALYQDQDVLAANPFMGELLEVFTHAVARPATATGAKYPEVSQAFWNAVHEVLEKKASGAQAVEQLEARLKQLAAKGW